MKIGRPERQFLRSVARYGGQVAASEDALRKALHPKHDQIGFMLESYELVTLTVHKGIWLWALTDKGREALGAHRQRTGGTLMKCANPECLVHDPDKLYACEAPRHQRMIDRGEREEDEVFCLDHLTRTFMPGQAWCHECADEYDGPGDHYYEREMRSGSDAAERAHMMYNARRLK